VSKVQARLAKVVALLALLVLPAGSAYAGGPLTVQADGTPYVWSTAAAVPYRTDNGPLSATVNEGAARTRVQSMFNVWQNVASATLSYARAGFINAIGAFTDGDVSTLAEYNAVLGNCAAGNQNPIIYDADAAILIALGKDEESVIGFAGFCALDMDAGEIVSSHVVMNGLFQDGASTPVPDLTVAEFDATFIHEFGHFSGLDHSQINVECATPPCGSDNLAGLPTMFPFLVSATQGSLSVDDIAWISRLYPAAGGSGFAATHGTITGTVYFSDGESHARLVNVVARLVDNPGTAGVNESRTTAGAGVSGYKFRLFNGNSISDPSGDDGLGTQAPGDIGLYEISVPPGNYMIEVESVDAQFTEGSSVGGPYRIPMPGAAPAPIGPISVAAGATSSGNDVTLIGSNDPRFDQFEGP
jgi:hypothetical protein